MRDFRYALRALAKSKGFATIAILSLALALGLNTTTFAVLDAFMHPYVPYRQPERLVSIGVRGDPRERWVRYPDRYQFLMDRMRFGKAVVYHRFARGLVAGPTLGEDMFFTDVSPNFFSVLDVQPERGRTFEEGEESAVIVGHSFWLRFFGGRASLANAHITVDNRSYAVIGVMPPGMTVPGFGIELWRVLPANILHSNEGLGYAQMIVRLRDDVSFESVKADLDALGKELTERHAVPAALRIRFVADTLKPDPFQLSEFHYALAACALAILLIACGNLANLMLARGVARRGELALRLAIGASRKTLVQQLLTEATILAAIGGTLGLFAALWGVHLSRTAIPRIPFLPIRVGQLGIGWRFFAFDLLATGVTVLLFGLLPALRASDVDVAEPLKASSGTTTGQHRRRYSMLAISQVALALVVLMAAAVLMRSAHRLATRAFGFDPHGLLQARVDLRDQRFPSSREMDARFDNVLQAVRRFPGVQQAALFSGAATDGHMAISDFEGDSVSQIVLHGYRVVTPDYLRAYGAQILQGRDFAPGDRQVAIVNQVAASALWPHLSPIGRMLKLGHSHSSMPWIQVVGVSSSMLGFEGDPNLPPQPEVFVVSAADTTNRRTMMIRVAREDGLLQINLAREIQAAGALKTPPRVAPWLWGYEETKLAIGFVTNIFGFIAVCGLGLASIGLYGVLAYAVSRRMREFAVRIALGAMGSDMFKLVLHDGTVMFLAGTGLGAFMAIGAAKWLDALLYGIPFSDVVALVVSELVLCAVAFLACLGPARRAMRADPLEILRAT